MPNQKPMRGVIATGSVDKGQGGVSIVLVNADGTAATTVKQQTTPADSTASTIAALVADHNALLAKLRTAGVLA